MATAVSCPAVSILRVRGGSSFAVQRVYSGHKSKSDVLVVVFVVWVLVLGWLGCFT